MEEAKFDLTFNVAAYPASDPQPAPVKSKNTIADNAHIVEKIVTKLESLGAFLGGSREKLKDRDFSTERDWDFDVQNEKTIEEFNWTATIQKTTPLSNYINAEFFNAAFEETEGYDNPFNKDQDFVGYYKHYLFPHITIIVRENLSRYVKMWEKIDLEFWKTFLWKSNPEFLTDANYDPTGHKIIRQAIIAQLYKMTDPPTLKDCM